MSKSAILKRLTEGHPGWVEWDELISLVRSLQFEVLSDDYLGIFYVSGSRLVFREPPINQKWPVGMPLYVAALLGMKADNWEMSGGYGEAFDGSPARKGAIFSAAGNDELLGFPVLDVPEGVYCFQYNSFGAGFFINADLSVVYPNSEAKRLEVLDSLDIFTKKNLRQVLAGRVWFDANSEGIRKRLLD